MIYDRLKEIGQILSDATRVDTLKLVASSPLPVSAQEIAAAFGPHPNAARHHLAKLESAGLVHAQVRRNPSGGRPAKLYTIGDQRIELVFPLRNFALLASLTLDALGHAGADGAALAAEAGRQHGRKVAAKSASERATKNGDTGYQQFASTVTTQLDAEVDIEEGPGKVVLTNQNCIFKEVGQNYPDVVCSLCRGIVEGIGDHFGYKVRLKAVKRITTGDDTCVSTLTVK